jgi:hypothetical protein
MKAVATTILENSSAEAVESKISSIPEILTIVPGN